jgi:hypothetical protein
MEYNTVCMEDTKSSLLAFVLAPPPPTSETATMPSLFLFLLSVNQVYVRRMHSLAQKEQVWTQQKARYSSQLLVHGIGGIQGKRGVFKKVRGKAWVY